MEMVVVSGVANRLEIVGLGASILLAAPLDILPPLRDVGSTKASVVVVQSLELVTAIKIASEKRELEEDIKGRFLPTSF